MPSTATEVDDRTPAQVGVNRLAKYGLLAVLAASGVNVIVSVIGLSVFDVPAEFVDGPFGPLGLGPVILNSAIGAIGATIVYGVIARFSTRPNGVFTTVAAVVLLLSFAMFLAPGLSGAPLAVFAVLAAMHVAAAVATVGVLTRARNPGMGSR